MRRRLMLAQGNKDVPYLTIEPTTITVGDTAVIINVYSNTTWEVE